MSAVAVNADRSIAVRMVMPMEDAEALANILQRLGPDLADLEQRIMDQLWLRTVLIEQRRRIRLSERQAFDERADRMLAALDPQEDPDG